LAIRFPGKLTQDGEASPNRFSSQKTICDIYSRDIFQEGDDMIPSDANGKVIESEIDYLETWKGMEECVHRGLTRSIGISNFNSEQITRLLESAEIAPVNNQVNTLNCYVHVGFM